MSRSQDNIKRKPSTYKKKTKKPRGAADKVEFLLELNKLEGTLLRQLRKEI